MAELIAIDPTSEDATNAQFDLIDAVNGVTVLDVDWDDPADDMVSVGTADTEGDLVVSSRPQWREPSMRVMIQKSTAAALDTACGQFQQKISKLLREGGTIKRTTTGGNVGVLDVLPGGPHMAVPADYNYVNQNTAIIPVKLLAKPYWRGPESAAQNFGPTSGDVEILVSSIKGDAPALARVDVTEGSSKDQWHCHWGARSRYYDSAATAVLAFEAENCTPLGGAAVATLTGASGGGTNNSVLQSSLTLDWQAMLSFQATGGGAYKSHIGDYEVICRLNRPSANTGSVSVALEWAQGDFTQVTRNDAVVYAADEREGDFTIARLGQVHLTKVKKGTQRWDGRIIAKSTVLGDDLYVDRVWLRPIAEGAGEINVSAVAPAVTSYGARDEFDQTAGNLGVKTAPVGGAWTTSGDTTDFTTGVSSAALRSTISDATIGRLAISGLAASTSQIVQVDVKRSAGSGSSVMMAAVGRYVDNSNFVRAQISGPFISLIKFVGGAFTVITNVSAPWIVDGVTYSIRLLIDASGRFAVWVFPQGPPSVGDPVIVGSDAVFATGGALASGKVGINDSNTIATASTRTYDNFWAASITPDAALFSGRQAELRSDSYIRQDAAGAVWGEKTVEGDYLVLPPSGREARPCELLLRYSRNDPATMTDPALDSISGTLFYTPRYRSLPA